MDDSHKLALIIGFYLSKYDRKGVSALGYSTFAEAFEDSSRCLKVKRNTIKNMRDEFDPVHSNTRVGWYQRALRGSRVRVVELFDGLSFEAMTDFILDILKRSDYRASPDVVRILKCIDERDDRRPQRVFVPRGITGSKAEDCFIRWFQEGMLGFKGNLIDRRDEGCGYDFLIVGESEHLIEVKGIAGNSGGILLTDKEWQTARDHPNYIIFIVYDLDVDPQWAIINNPGQTLRPSKNIRTTVQINWHVPALQLGLE